MVKNTAKMIGIKKMMKKSVPMSTLGGPVPRAAAAASDALPGDSAPQAKRSRNAETKPKEGVSGDILEDNFLVEDLAAGDQGDGRQGPCRGQTPGGGTGSAAAAVACAGQGVATGRRK